MCIAKYYTFSNSSTMDCKCLYILYYDRYTYIVIYRGISQIYYDILLYLCFEFGQSNFGQSNKIKQYYHPLFLQSNLEKQL